MKMDLLPFIFYLLFLLLLLKYVGKKTGRWTPHDVTYGAVHYIAKFLPDTKKRAIIRIKTDYESV